MSILYPRWSQFRSHADSTTRGIRTTVTDRLNPYLGYFSYPPQPHLQSVPWKHILQSESVDDDGYIYNSSRKGRENAGQRESHYPNFLTQEERERIHIRKINVFAGIFHASPRQYSGLHCLSRRHAKMMETALRVRCRSEQQNDFDEQELCENNLSPLSRKLLSFRPVTDSDGSCSLDELSVGGEIMDESPTGHEELFFQINDEARELMAAHHAKRKLLLDIDKTSEFLDEGGFATVLRADCSSSIGRKVAVKSFKRIPENNPKDRESQLKLITEELALAKSLEHPNIVRVIDHIHVDSSYVYMIMELADAGNLEKMLYLRRRFSEEEVIAIASQLLKALAFLHNNGFLHGDVKAANIMFQTNHAVHIEDSSEDGNSSTSSSSSEGSSATKNLHRSPLGLTLKLCDFGASRSVTPVTSSSVHLGYIPYEEIGTPGYLSPEHLQREPLSTAIDSWSSGVVLYQCISGYFPFRPATACFDGPPKMNGPLWSNTSGHVKHMVQRFLNIDPFLRLTAKQASEFSWLSYHSSTVYSSASTV